MTQVVHLSDGRDLTVECCGDPSGTPIMLLHGTPGSRSGPRPRTSVLYRLGVRLISYDRPGYGQSSRHRGRRVIDAASDVAEIADRLGLDQFSIVGRSGGGPHALACAAKLGDRVRSVAVLVGLAPSDAKDLGWYNGMTESNVREFSIAEAGEAAAMTTLAAKAAEVRADPQVLLRTLEPELKREDERVVNDFAIRRLLTKAFADALQDSSDGWIDDVIALRTPWGFEPATISRPVLLWHGAKDGFCPVGHAYWLADQITSSTIAVQSDSAHFGAVEVLPKVLAWIKEASTSEGLGIKGVQQPSFRA